MKAFDTPAEEDINLDDEKIVSLFFSRDESAIEQTSLKYGKRLRNIAFGITEDALTAEECENDTYLEAWNTIPPQNPSTYFYLFLARIIRHISLDVCRKRSSLKRSAVLTELTAEMEACIPARDNASDQLEAKELGEAISRYLHSLSEEKQTIFIRRYWYLDSVDRIASSLGIGVSKVKMTLMRCRNELKTYLKKEGYFE